MGRSHVAGPHAFYVVRWVRRSEGQKTTGSTRMWATIGKARKEFHMIAQAWHGQYEIVSVRREGE